MTNLTGSNLNRREATGPKGEGRDSPSTFPRYPEYKDSGVEWLGEVPAHWEVVKLSYLSISKGGGTPPKGELQYWNGSIPWVTPKDMKRQWITSTIDTLSEAALHASPVSMVEPGHVLIVFRSGILRHRIPVAINKVPVTVNQDMRAYDVRPRLLPDFFLRLTQGLNRELLPEWSKQGATVESLDSELVSSTQLPVPPRADQEAITSFLDHETAHIDALVAEQQHLIELLKEKRQAVISHAVTKGLDPDAPMKDSGVEWLGEVPAHWEVIKLSYLAISKGGGTPPKDELQYWNGNIPWVTPKDMKRQWITSTIDTLSEAALHASPVSMIEPGHVLIVFRSGILRHRIPVAINKVPVTVNQDMRAYDVRPRLLPDFFLRLTQGLNRGLLPEWSKQGATVESLDSELVSSTQLPVPPRDEQEAITGFLDREISCIESLVEEGESVIKLLQERRSALISAAVTGKIDVRHWNNPEGSEVNAQLMQTEGEL